MHARESQSQNFAKGDQSGKVIDCGANDGKQLLKGQNQALSPIIWLGNHGTEYEVNKCCRCLMYVQVIAYVPYLYI